jgi:splicing factor 3B subunit 1
MDPEIVKTQEERRRMEQQLASLTSVTFDTDLYGGNDGDAYATSIPVNEDDENIDTMDNETRSPAIKLAYYTAPKFLLTEDDNDDLLGFKKPQRGRLPQKEALTRDLSREV